MAPLAPRLQTACNLLLGAGAVVLLVALYLGFAGQAGEALVYSLLAITALLFASVAVMVAKPRVEPAVPAAHRVPVQPASPADVPTLQLQMTLADVLQSALRSDPEGVKRLVAAVDGKPPPAPQD